MAAFDAALMRPMDEVLQGIGGVAEGMPSTLAGKQLTKFRAGGLQYRARGRGKLGLMSGAIGGLGRDWRTRQRISKPENRRLSAN